VNAAVEIPKNIETPKDVDATKVLSFLKDVFQINTDKYDAILTKSSTRLWNDVALTVGQYELVYSDYDNGAGSSSLTVNFNFWNSELVVCSLYRTNYDDGVIHYIQKPDGDLRKIAAGVLQRYQACTKDEQITQMIKLLNTVEFTDGYIKTNDNLQLAITVNDYATYLMWSNTVNDAGYSRLILEFRNGELTEFSDDRAFYVLGSSVVTVSLEQAISIALEQATLLSYTVDGEVVSDFNIVNEHIQVQPSTLPRPSESLLVRYPIWIVDLPLADIYPGMVSFIRVMLWADTGKVISVQPFGAGFPNTYMDDSAHGAASLQDSSLSSASNNLSLVVYLAGACIAIISLSIVAVVLKRRNK
jgi:hypothetical protein